MQNVITDIYISLLKLVQTRCGICVNRPLRESDASTTWFLQLLLVQGDGMHIVSPERGLSDVVGAVVSEDLPVLAINVGLRQGAKAMKELGVKHQILWFQDVLGQLQFCFGSDKTVGLDMREHVKDSRRMLQKL